MAWRGQGGGEPGEQDVEAAFGYHVTGSTGTLFLYGIVTGALALAGLSLLLAGARRTSRRGRDARRGLAQSRRETAAVSADRDDLRGQRDTARAYTASTLGDNSTAPNSTAPNSTAQNSTAPNGTDPGSRGPSRFARLFARRPASPQTDPQTDALATQVPAAQPEPPAGQAAAVPAGASAPAE
ncbi:MAG TPA: hypothetical protein VG123_31530 [Streptosporangiaceae bacterium]|nr:hypothetical protein [Streptosporangiaceae bacterium]